MDDDVWYFAYGSNLDPYQKENRTGPIREAKRARLPNYRFAFNKIKNIEEKTGYANVMPDDGQKFGVLYSDVLKKHWIKWTSMREHQSTIEKK